MAFLESDKTIIPSFFQVPSFQVTLISKASLVVFNDEKNTLYQPLVILSQCLFQYLSFKTKLIFKVSSKRIPLLLILLKSLSEKIASVLLRLSFGEITTGSNIETLLLNHPNSSLTSIEK
ncbi:MAG: hypothetical protein LBC61_04245 [Candidatus Peribacteria bacterium]|nr:hypothetical protein [Candidatus Peribacteria bacterium]